MNAFDINAYLEGNSNGLIWDMELKKRLDDEMCIERYGFKVYSQNDEDGIIEEIFARIGTTNKKFIEFGVQDGVESNGHYLLLKGWSGFWIECDSENCKKIEDKFAGVISSKHLAITKQFITKDNINELLLQNEQIGEIDLLSIDIDGNDYHVWKSLDAVNPRVVVIEYNAKIPPSCDWIMPYCEQHIWDGGDKHGASLSAMERLGREKGYSLVGTNISGVNAFFVRNDCMLNNFAVKSVKELYNPPRFYKKFFTGHPSYYCLKDLPEGRLQMFCKDRNILLFKTGFHKQESIESIKRWMSEKDAVVWIKDMKNKFDKLIFRVENPAILYDINGAPKILKIKVENNEIIEKNLRNNEEEFEIKIERQRCRNDEVLEVILEIDEMWCPLKAGINNDDRNLGVLIKEIECI